MTMLPTTNYNYWIMKRKIKDFKASLRFVLIENVNGHAAKLDWSEVYWTDEAFESHDHVTYDEVDETIIWTMPENLRVDGFCILDENDVVLYLQHFIGGITLFIGEQINVNISGIYVGV